MAIRGQSIDLDEPSKVLIGDEPSKVVPIGAPRLPFDYSIALTVAIYITVTISSGRIYRYPFDDEIASTLVLVAKHHVGGLLKMLLLGFPDDAFNAPLCHLVFALGSSAGLSLPGLRWISVGFTAAALVIWNWLTIDALEIRLRRPPVRMLIAILFGLTPLALGLGDALRYYPLLALLVSIAYLIALKAGSWWFLSAIPLGLAADSCPLAIVPFIAIAAERHFFERRIRLKEGVSYVGLAGIFAIPAFTTFALLLTDNQSHFSSEFESGAMVAIFKTALGFFGGYTLGISQAFFIAVSMVAIGYLFFSARKLSFPPSRRIWNIAMVTLAISFAVPLSAIAIPRSFVFAAPVVSAVAGLGFAYALDSQPALASTAYAIVLLISLGAAIRSQANDSPFKRNLAIPYAQLADFVNANKDEDTLVASSDRVAAFSLDGHPGLCVAGFEDGNWWLNKGCVDSPQRNTIIVVRNNPLAEVDPAWTDTLEKIVMSRTLVAKAHFGIDNDARLKSKLSGTDLPREIVSVEVYR